MTSLLAFWLGAIVFGGTATVISALVIKGLRQQINNLRFVARVRGV